MTTEQRLERLERKNRRMRRITVVAVAVAVVSLASSIYVWTREKDRGEVPQESKAAREARAVAEALLAEHREREAEALVRVAGLECNRHLESADLWYVVTGKYPRPLEVMDFDVQDKEFTIPRNSPEVADWIASRLVFIDVEPDPWGNPYVLEVYANGMLVRSFGPDGEKDTEDDIDVCLEEEED